MPRVIVLQYGDFTDRLTGVRFVEQSVSHPEHGGQVFLGVADVDDDTARKFQGREGFHVDGLPPVKDEGDPEGGQDQGEPQAPAAVVKAGRPRARTARAAATAEAEKTGSADTPPAAE